MNCEQLFSELGTDYTSYMESLQKTVQSKTAVPTAQVYVSAYEKVQLYVCMESAEACHGVIRIMLVPSSHCLWRCPMCGAVFKTML